ncbi:uncharacterized protein J3D65DRAFT_466044 [Phyllosticta citribraziliensis]|uniref:Uncharacterized protein n=1 Tax=Phyllosticta citribraziliensis TaxID=989973 RepID=A0ABR1LFK7_9PEZI
MLVYEPAASCTFSIEVLFSTFTAFSLTDVLSQISLSQLSSFQETFSPHIHHSSYPFSRHQEIPQVSGMSSSSSPVDLYKPQQRGYVWPSPPSYAEFDPNVTNAADYGDPWAGVKAHGRMVDAAVLSGNPCIYGSHTKRQGDCRDCSTVALFRILKGRKGNLKKESGQSTAHKADTPCLDLYLEYTAMKKAENAGKSSCKEFDQFVNNELKGQVRVCANAPTKHWVKTNFWLSEDGALYWGNGDGKQRQIKREDGSKTQGRIMRDYEAAELVHDIHQKDHCGRDALIARIQQEGYKPPVKEVVTAWIGDCTGCDRGTKNRKRSRDDSTPAAVSGPPSKRQKADPRAPKRKERKDSTRPTPDVVPAEAALLPTAPAPATPAITAELPEEAIQEFPIDPLDYLLCPSSEVLVEQHKEAAPQVLQGLPAETPQFFPLLAPAAPAINAELPHEAFQDVDEFGVASLEFLLEGVYDEAEFNATVESVENAAQEWGIPENTQASPADLDITWFDVDGTLARQDASRSSG